LTTREGLNPPTTSILTRTEAIHNDIREEDILITQMKIVHAVAITIRDIVMLIAPTTVAKGYTTTIAIKMA